LVSYNPRKDTDALNALTERILGCAFTVSNTLGCGFLEKVYENALAHELRRDQLHFAQQAPAQVHYDGVLVGDYVADLIVDDRVLVELKAARSLDDVHVAQCINYLRATNLPCCLLLNFGTPRLGIKRLLHPRMKNLS
jgi:GxxExxY protein